MKTYSKIIFLLMVVLILSCDKERIESPPLGRTEAAYFNDASEFRMNVVAIYSKLIDIYHFNPEFQWGNFTSSLWTLPGDDLTETQGARRAEELFDGSMNPTNFRLRFFFARMYILNSRANVVIEKVRTVDFSGFDHADEIAAMEGEALFLRAYAYFNLFNVYGNVPLITQRLLTQEDTNTPKSDKLVILDQVIEDARLALDILPESWAAEYVGRATKNSARALLAKALVFRANYTGNTADYTEAITVFNSIDAVLVDTFTDNFNVYTENNPESLFEITSAKPSGGGNIILGNDGPWRGVENVSLYRGHMRPNGDNAANWAPTKFIITNKLLNNFGTDPRISVFLDSEDGEDGRIFLKYSLPGMDELDPYHQSSMNNERVLRYADLKLIAAEASLKTGNASAAIAHMNDIRARARTWALESGAGDGTIPADYNTGETNQATVMQWIMDERFVELAGEGHRWWDLKRWHTAGDINLTGWTGSDEHFSTNLASPVQFDVNKHLLFPLPQDEIDRNSAITENNPGY